MKCLKAGKEPVRGNPNNPDEQEEFDVKEDGNDDKPSVRPSLGLGDGSSGYPSLGPPPDLGIPDDDDYKGVGGDSSSSEEEEEQKKPEPPKPKHRPTPAPKSGGPVKKDKNFYKAVEQAKKHCKNAISNLGYSKVDSTVSELEQALAILRPYENV